MARKVAVVTGGNKGIGLALVQGLCDRFNGEVYLTSRDEKRGLEAVKKLNDLGYKPHYHQLDITDRRSVRIFHDYLKKKYGGFDILINNAAIAFHRTSEEPLILQAEQTIFVNYHSLAATCEILFPILRPHGRVINLTGALGHLSMISNEIVKQRFADKNLTELKLNKIVNDYVKAVRRGTNEQEGWGSNSYVISKVAVCALTFIHHKLFGRNGISINCYHPGYVQTDMSRNVGPMNIEQGAMTGLYLALEAPQSLKGQLLWYDNSIVDWFGPIPSELYIKNETPIAVPAEIIDLLPPPPPVEMLPADQPSMISIDPSPAIIDDITPSVIESFPVQFIADLPPPPVEVLPVVDLPEDISTPVQIIEDVPPPQVVGHTPLVPVVNGLPAASDNLLADVSEETNGLPQGITLLPAVISTSIEPLVKAEPKFLGPPIKADDFFEKESKAETIVSSVIEESPMVATRVENGESTSPVPKPRTLPASNSNTVSH